MAPTATRNGADRALGDQLRDVRSRISEQRAERARLQRERDEAREAFATASPSGGGSITSTPEFARAERTARALNECHDRLESLGDDERALLGMLGGAPAGPGTGGGSDEGSFLRDPNALASLDAMSASTMPVGRVALGPAISRDGLVEAIGEGVQQFAAAPDTDITPAMRRGTARGAVPTLRRPLRLLDLIPSAPMDGSSFDYVQELTGTYEAAEVVEGAVKPGTAAPFVDAEAKAETIAWFTKLKKQALADTPALEVVLRDRLIHGVLRRVEAQVIAGPGTGGNLRGILATTGIGSVAYSASELAADQALEGIVTVLLSGAVPNAIVLNPRDWAAMLKAKSEGSGEYFSAGAFSVQAEALWGTTAIPSASIAQGTVLVGDFALGCTVFVREGVGVIVSDADSDDLTRNRVTLLGEGRFAVAVWQPAAFATVDLTA